MTGEARQLPNITRFSPSRTDDDPGPLQLLPDEVPSVERNQNCYNHISLKMQYQVNVGYSR